MLASGAPMVLAFVGAMLAGMMLAPPLERRTAGRYTGRSESMRIVIVRD